MSFHEEHQKRNFLRLSVEEGGAALDNTETDRRRSLLRAAVAAVSIMAFAGAAILLAGRQQAGALARAGTAGVAQEYGGSLQPASVKLGSDTWRPQCPSGYSRILDEAECRAAMPLLQGGDPDNYQGSFSESDFPSGCYKCDGASDCDDGVWFNPYSTGAAASGAYPLCQQNFAITPGKTLFVGDSDVDYWHSFLNAVPQAYNVGIGGQTCADVMQEIGYLLKSFQPTWVVLVCGENDLDLGTGVGKTYRRFKEVVEKILSSGARVVVMGTKPEVSTKNLHNKYKKYDSKVKSFAVKAAAKTKGIPPVPPVIFVDSFKNFTAMGNPGALYDPSEKPNYLHLGPKGYAIWDKWVAAAKADTLGCVVWEGPVCVHQVQDRTMILEQAALCSAGLVPITTELECLAATGLAGTSAAQKYQGSENEVDWPGGCYYCGPNVADCTTGTWFNKNLAGAYASGTERYCKSP